MKKKNAILQAGIELFSDFEYSAVSSIKIADEAKVSDALIFKHFKNKIGLFNAVIFESENYVSDYLNEHINSDDPKLFIKSLIEMLFEIHPSDYKYFKLLLKQKFFSESRSINIWKEVFENMVLALSSLNFSDPEKEALLLNSILENFLERIIINGQTSMLQYKYFLIHKYTL